MSSSWSLDQTFKKIFLNRFLTMVPKSPYIGHRYLKTLKKLINFCLIYLHFTIDYKWLMEKHLVEVQLFTSWTLNAKEKDFDRKNSIFSLCDIFNNWLLYWKAPQIQFGKCQFSALMVDIIFIFEAEREKKKKSQRCVLSFDKTYTKATFSIFSQLNF